MTGWNPARNLPPDWDIRRSERLDLDGHRCQLRYDGCTGRATEVHHTGDNTDHRIEHLLSVCTSCHRTETQRQSAEAIRAGWAETKPRQPRHPGLL